MFLCWGRVRCGRRKTGMRRYTYSECWECGTRGVFPDVPADKRTTALSESLLVSLTDCNAEHFSGIGALCGAVRRAIDPCNRKFGCRDARRVVPLPAGGSGPRSIEIFTEFSHGGAERARIPALEGINYIGDVVLVQWRVKQRRGCGASCFARSASWHLSNEKRGLTLRNPARIRRAQPPLTLPPLHLRPRQSPLLPQVMRPRT